MERLRGHISDVKQLPARMNVQNAMGLLTLSGNVCGVKNYPIYCRRLCHWTTHHTNSLTQKHTHTQAGDRVCTCIFHPFCFNPIPIIRIRTIVIITILSGPSFLWTIFEMFLHLSLSPPVLTCDMIWKDTHMSA